MSTTSFILEFGACATPKEALKVVSQWRTPSAAELGLLLYEANTQVPPGLLGQCLGHHDPFWQELAREYPANFAREFTGVGIVDALRNYLWRFRLPGESAQIERVLGGFARGFFLHNVQREGKDAQPHVGYYVVQPYSPKPCCIHCGMLDGDKDQPLRLCTGCNSIYFCRRCAKQASKYGHAAVCSIGYGRACLAARGLQEHGGQLEYKDGNGTLLKIKVPPLEDTTRAWTPRGCPARSEDAVMVLCYAIIMLTTNLHNVKVKQKMAKHEFIMQNRGVNDGNNFPGDFLARIYDDIEQRELEVMPSA